MAADYTVVDLAHTKMDVIIIIKNLKLINHHFLFRQC